MRCSVHVGALFLLLHGLRWARSRTRQHTDGASLSQLWIGQKKKRRAGSPAVVVPQKVVLVEGLNAALSSAMDFHGPEANPAWLTLIRKPLQEIYQGTTLLFKITESDVRKALLSPLSYHCF